MTLAFLGMFVASSAGEILFNKEEADILMHRPVTARELLWAKIGVLVQVSLWLAGAFNLVGLYVGAVNLDGGWVYPIAHAVSTALEALFCTGSVVLMYQLCLRWLGRERLEGLMTTVQVLVSITIVIGAQIVPRLMMRFGGKINFTSDSWWVALLPPAWFAGFDDALAGRGASSSWLLAGIGLIATTAVLWFAFGKLANDYEAGLQQLNQTVSRKRKEGTRRRWLDTLVNVPPLSWLLREPVSRASFLLTVAYLVRDRDVKLRVYPSLAPMLILPFIFLFQSGGVDKTGFGIAFSGNYLGLMPMMGLYIIRYSQQWQAADVFRAAPVDGPARLCDGARGAVLIFLTLPLVVILGAVAFLMTDGSSRLLLLIPGIMVVPIYALIPCIRGNAVPFSLPTEEAKSAGRGVGMFGVVIVALLLAMLTTYAWAKGWFWWLVLIEGILVIGIFSGMRKLAASARWPSLE